MFDGILERASGGFSCNVLDRNVNYSCPGKKGTSVQHLDCKVLKRWDKESIFRERTAGKAKETILLSVNFIY